MTGIRLGRIEDPDDYPELREVVTMAEAARLAGVHYTTVEHAMNRGRIAAIKCGRIWLVPLRSLWKVYEPPN